MKKTCFYRILPLLITILAASCTNAPTNQPDESIWKEPVLDEPIWKEPVLDEPIWEEPAREPEPETVDITDAIIEETVPEETVLAEPEVEPEIEEAITEAEPPVPELEPVAEIEPPLPEPEPEPPAPALVIAPEPLPPPPPQPQPPVVPAPAPKPEPQPQPPVVPPPAPRPAPQPQPPVVPEPKPEPPPIAPPEKKTEPELAYEPPQREKPELPYPTLGFIGQQNERSVLETEPPIVFSRVVRATVGQLVEIPFRGTGWVYLGEISALRGIVYDSRRLDPEGQSFIFRTEAAGTYALKFYRQDFIRDFILNDYVQVIVGEAPETAATGWFNPPIDRGRVTAEPRWPSSLEEAMIRRGTAAAATPAETKGADRDSAGTGTNGTGSTGTVVSPPVQAPTPGSNTATPPAAVPEQAPPLAAPNVGQTSPATPSSAVPEPVPADLPPPLNLSPDEYLKKAKEEFDAGKVAAAIFLLDQFSLAYPSGSDEAWWLYGQFYEASSPSRNILTALDYYRRLIREYPQSSRVNDARRRIAYLERFYININ